jgi:hypothetical protein
LSQHICDAQKSCFRLTSAEWRWIFESFLYLNPSFILSSLTNAILEWKHLIPLESQDFGNEMISKLAPKVAPYSWISLENRFQKEKNKEHKEKYLREFCFSEEITSLVKYKQKNLLLSVLSNLDPESCGLKYVDNYPIQLCTERKDVRCIQVLLSNGMVMTNEIKYAMRMHQFPIASLFLDQIYYRNCFKPEFRRFWRKRENRWTGAFKAAVRTGDLELIRFLLLKQRIIGKIIISKRRLAAAKRTKNDQIIDLLETWKIWNKKKDFYIFEEEQSID